MPAERVILHRTNIDKTEVIEQYPKTISSQVYDFDNGKFLNETLNGFTQQLEQIAISVRQFGAIGDGATDDTDAFIACLIYCASNGYAMYIPVGTYVCSTFGIIDLESFGLRIFGDGARSIIKRKNNSVTRDNIRLFRFRPKSGVNVKNLTIENLFIDSNAIGNPLLDPNEMYAYEHCADIQIAGNNVSSRIETVNLNNLIFEDGIADHVYFAGYSDCFVDTVNVTNFKSSKRNRTRSDITITGKVGVFNGVNIDCDKFEIEINSLDLTKKSVVNLTNINCKQALDVAGAANLSTGVFDNLTLNVTNSTCANFLLQSMQVIATNCTFYDDNQARMVGMGESAFTNCEFLSKSVDTNITEPFLSLTYGKQNIKFINCKFDFVDKSITRTSTAGWVSQTNTGMTDTTNQKSYVLIKDCSFANGMAFSVVLSRGGHLRLENNEYNTPTAVSYYGTQYTNGTFNLSSRLEVVGGNYNSQTFIRLSSGQNYGVEQLDWIKLINVKLDADITTDLFSVSSSAYANVKFFLSDVTFYATNPPTNAISKIVGMKWKLKNPLLNKPYEWVATKFNSYSTSNSNQDSWHTLSKCVGTTSERPTSAEIVGKYLEYYDTTLNKPVYYDGVSWKDSSGAVS